MLLEIMLAATQVYVYDGDTVRIRGIDQTFRVVGLDTPEIAGKCESEKVLARRARDRLRELVKDPTSRMQEVLCYGSNFGRRCGVIKVNGKDVAITLVEENLADPYYCGSKGCPKRRNWCGQANPP